MAIVEFQRAFADLIASPVLCLQARVNPAQVFASYGLNARERVRLERMVRDEGMSINCTLFRVNRFTPVYSVLPLTCAMLAEHLHDELDGFWAASRDATLQYHWEAWRFGEWVLARIASGELQGGALEDVIRFELASYEVKAEERDVPGGLRRRILKLRYDPEQLLDPTFDKRQLEPLQEPVTVLLDADGDTLQVYRL